MVFYVSIIQFRMNDFVSVREALLEIEYCDKILHNIVELVSKLNIINKQIESQKKYIAAINLFRNQI